MLLVSSFLREVFLRFHPFPPFFKKQHFQVPIQSCTMDDKSHQVDAHAAKTQLLFCFVLFFIFLFFAQLSF